MDNMKNEQSQEEMLLSLRKELKVNRYCSLLVALLLVMVIGCGVCLYQVLEPAVAAIEAMEPTVTELGKIDVEAFNQKMEQLDVEELNRAIEELDVEELSEALVNLNDAADAIRDVSESITGFSDSLKESFGGWFGMGNTGNSGI